MAKSLYISAIAPGSSKSLITLGVMELLSKRVGKLGFFRPVVRGADHPDNDAELVRRRYQLAPSQIAHALTHTQAQHLIAEGQIEELLKRAIEAYRSLERQCDFVLCAGLDTTDLDPSLVDNVDARIASQLGTPVLLAVSGWSTPVDDLVSAVRAEREALIQAGCAVVATIVSRVASNHYADATAALQQAWPFADPIFIVPEEMRLTKPTLAEVTTALQANLLYGELEALKRDVLSVKAAAMQVPNFLSHIQEGGLVLTPGDRADILLGCLAATLSDTYPNLAGVMLTGGLALPASMHQLLAGFTRPMVPILSVETDTYNTATLVNQVQGQITPDNDRKIALALGVFEQSIDGTQLADRIVVSRSDRKTPLMFEYDLIERAKANKRHIVLPEGTEDRILQAAEILLHRGVVNLTLLGNEAQIRETIARLGLNLEGVTVHDPARSPWLEDFAASYFDLRQHKGITRDYAHDVMQDVSYFGTMMVYKGLADGMVSGSVHTTAHTIRPALEFIRTRPDVSIVSSVFLMGLDDRILVYGDCAVNPNPNPEQLADIAISSAETARTFGIEPLVAMLSYSTGESGSGEDVEKVKEATHIARDRRPDLKIEGPLQYDAAVDESVAKTKLPDSEVAGHATVFIFPDLNTGNNTYKAVQRSANAVAIGPVLQGLKKPVNDLSRGCTVTDIVNTVAITAIQAQAI